MSAGHQIPGQVRFLCVCVSLLTSLCLASGCCRGMRSLVPTCISGSVTTDFPDINSIARIGNVTAQEGRSLCNSEAPLEGVEAQSSLAAKLISS